MFNSLKKINRLARLLALAGASVWAAHFGAPPSWAEPIWITRPSSGDAFLRHESKRPFLSGDGGFLVFQTKAALAAGDDGSSWDIYIYDRKKEELSLLFPSAGRHAFGGPRISADGKTVVFYSYPEHVLNGQKPRVAEIFSYDRTWSRLENLTPFGGGTFHDGECLFPDLDARGRLVVFTSNATTMGDIQTRGFRNVYLFDRDMESMRLLSRHSTGEDGDRPSLEPRIDASGSFVSFLSAASNLDSSVGLKNLTLHLYLLDREKNRLARVDTEENGFPETPGQVGQYDISFRARHIAFEWLPRVVDAPYKTLEGGMIYLFDRRKKKVVNLTPADVAGRAAQPALSGDGRFVTFIVHGTEEEPLSGGLVIMDRRSGEWVRPVEGPVLNPAISMNGRFIAYQAFPEGVDPEDRKAAWHIFMLENPLVK